MTSKKIKSMACIKFAKSNDYGPSVAEPEPERDVAPDPTALAPNLILNTGGFIKKFPNYNSFILFPFIFINILTIRN
jgi:hypothetical protein